MYYSTLYFQILNNSKNTDMAITLTKKKLLGQFYQSKVNT